MHKYRYMTERDEGIKSVVHYVIDPKTGKTYDYKFKQLSNGAHFK